MKVAVIGSRSLKVENLGEYIPKDTTEIISGGSRGVDLSARKYAIENGIKLTEILPEYEKFGRYALLERNDLIVDSADMVIVFWDGQSIGAKYVIDYCNIKDKKVIVNLIK